MAGITEKHVDIAEAWLVQHGHSMDGIAHPEGDEARMLAALALELNVFTASPSATSELIAELLAYKHSGGRVGNVG